MSLREHNIIGTCVLIVIMTFILLGSTGCAVIHFGDDDFVFPPKETEASMNPDEVLILRNYNGVAE